MQTMNIMIERNKEGNIAEHYLEKIDDIKTSRKKKTIRKTPAGMICTQNPGHIFMN